MGAAMTFLLIVLGLGLLAVPVSLVALIVGQARLRGRVERLEAAQAGAPAAAGAARPVAAPPPPASAEADAVRPAAETEAPVAPRAPLPWERALPGAGTGGAGAADAAPPRAADAAESAGSGAGVAATLRGPVVMRPDRAAALGRWLRDNWVYAVSALSLALAGVFLVQYGAERGLLPPAMRVAMAMALGAALIVAAEVIRRRWGDGGRSSTAFLPSVFAGAGLVALFAAMVAARQQYGLIGPEAAMAGLCIVAALAVLIGWFYGPFLAGFGLLGAAAAPFLVAGAGPAPAWLHGYFVLIAATGLAVDAARRWAWVSVLALMVGYLGALAVWSGGDGTGTGWLALAMSALALLAIALPPFAATPRHEGAMILETLWRRGKGDWPEFPTRLAGGAVAATSAGLLILPPDTAADSLMALSCLAGLALALTIWASGARALADLAILPALGLVARLSVEGLSHWPMLAEFWARAEALRPPETAAPLTVTLLLLMAAAASLAAVWRSGAAGEYRAAWAAGAALTAPGAAVALELFWKPATVIGAYPWALHALALAALMVVFAARFAAADGEDRRRAAYATLSALSLIALALFLIATKGALTLALGALALSAAALDRRFRLPEMSYFIQAGTLVLGWRLIIDPGLGWAIEAPLWEVWLAYGGALAGLAAALWLYRPLDRRGASVFLESALAGYGALFANLLLTRWIERTYGSAELFTHWSLSLEAMPWLILALIQLYRMQLGGPLRLLRAVIAGIALPLATVLLLVAALPLSPLLWGGDVKGPMVLDTLALAYLLPAAVLLSSLLRLAQLPRRLRQFLGGTGAASAALYAALEIRRFWQGNDLSVEGVSQGELYSYTLALMLLGAALLYQAIARRSAGLRRLAMAVIGLTVAKVFLIDASGLSGLTRVFSFLLLGLALAGLAFLNRWAAGQSGEVDGAGEAGDQGGKA